MASIRLTAALVTYNRREELKAALESLARQKGVRREDVEVLVVDNGSTDGTMDLLKELAPGFPIELRTMEEPTRGACYARNTAVLNARGEIFAFLDDDAVADENWMAAHIAAYEDPDVSGVMGRILPRWFAERPDWLDDDLATYLTIVDYGDNPFPAMMPDYCPVGANMSMKRQVIIDAGLFDVRFGPLGSRQLANEENDLCWRTQQMGARVVYWPDAVVWHGVPAARLTAAWFARRISWQGRANLLMDRKYRTRGYIARKAVWESLVRAPVFTAAAALDYLLRNRKRAARRATVPCYAAGYMKQLLLTMVQRDKAEMTV